MSGLDPVVSFCGPHLPMGLHEPDPRRLLQPIGRGLQAVFAKDGGDRASGDLVIEVRQRALDPGVALAAVLGGHPHD